MTLTKTCQGHSHRQAQRPEGRDGVRDGAPRPPGTVVMELGRERGGGVTASQESKPKRAWKQPCLP